jgi:MOSC domain-containing protein YiiM
VTEAGRRFNHVSDSTLGTVAGIAVRTEPLGTMREIEVAEVTAGAGITGDLPVSPKRGVTLISAEQWEEVQHEAGAALPWHTRRANVLVRGLRLGNLIGKRIRVGDAEILVHGETRPCAVMDALYEGLQAILKPGVRAGVHGQVLTCGTFTVGDPIIVLDTVAT